MKTARLTPTSYQTIITILFVVALSSCTSISHNRNENTNGFTKWMPEVDFRKFLSEKELKDQNTKNFWDNGHWILAAEGRWKNGQQQYRIKIGDAPKNRPYFWMWYFGVEKQDFDKLIAKFSAEGYTMVYRNSFRRPIGTTLYQGVWHKENPRTK